MIGEHRGEAREAALRAYFQGVSAPATAPPGLASLGVGALLVLIGVAMTSGSRDASAGCGMAFVVPGLVVALWAGGRLWRGWSKARRGRARALAGPTDAAVQAWLDAGLRRVQEQALQALGLADEDLVSDLLTLVAPVVWETEGIRPTDLLMRVGLDGRTRFGVYSVAIIALTERHLGIFRCVYGFLEDRLRHESTCEYHYRDIVSVSTGEALSSLVLPSGKQLTTVQELRVSVPNGEAIRITVDVPGLRSRTGGAEMLPSTGAEKAVQAIRTMLRQQKA